MFAFWFLSQRDWEVKCPGLLLAESGALCRICCPAIGRRKGTEVSGGDFWCAPVLTGLLQNREDQTWDELRHMYSLPALIKNPVCAMCTAYTLQGMLQ